MKLAPVFIAATAVWIGSMIFVYQHNKTEEDPKPEITSKNVKTAIVENFREPIFPNKEKMQLDNYPRANGSIYGEDSGLMMGYPFYDKAY
jgi:hypothetical protein